MNRIHKILIELVVVISVCTPTLGISQVLMIGNSFTWLPRVYLEGFLNEAPSEWQFSVSPPLPPIGSHDHPAGAAELGRLSLVNGQPRCRHGGFFGVDQCHL